MSGLSDEALKQLNDDIQIMRDKLDVKMKQIPKLKQSLDFNMIKFGIIAFICIFFAIIIIDNTIKTIRLYSRSKRQEKLSEKISTPNDTNEFLNFENNLSYKQELQKNIDKANKQQNKELRQAKLEKLASNKNNTDLNPDKLQLEANINLTSIDKEHDDYEYKDMKSNSFWNMLFVKKEYYNL